MPASALDVLSRLNIMYPMMFSVRSSADSRQTTHCGVLEFSSPEGVVYLPPWVLAGAHGLSSEQMLKSLRLGSGDLVVMANVALPVGNYVKIQPQSVDFLDITDPRAV